MREHGQTQRRWLARAIAAAAVLTLPPLAVMGSCFLDAHGVETASARSDSLSPTTLALADVTVDVAFAPEALELSRDQVLNWITMSAQAVVHYYSRFPVPHVRMLLTPYQRSRRPFWHHLWWSRPIDQGLARSIHYRSDVAAGLGYDA